jgi:hypothetical protein
MNRRFDWKSRHDPRSRQFAIRRVGEERPARKATFWTPGPLLDQGPDGACVGFGWSGELGASPVRVKGITNNFAFSLYAIAKTMDEWEGEDYEGTSVLAGAKAVSSAGYMEEYRWAFGIEDVIDALIVHGPVVIGIPWLDGMFSTRKSGLVECTGDVAGGHCVYLTGYHPHMRMSGEGWFRRHEVIRARQSWGDWGLRGGGDFYFRVGDLSRLLQDQGEACVPMGRAYGPAQSGA